MKRIIAILPILVLVAGFGIVASFQMKRHRMEQRRMEEKQAAVADKVDRLPAADGEHLLDRNIAEEAFAHPERIDDASPCSDPLVSTEPMRESGAENRIAPRGRDLVFQQPEQVAPVLGTPPENANPPAVSPSYFWDDFVKQRSKERIDPGSEEYRKKVDGLMEMRQRRLLGKDGHHE